MTSWEKAFWFRSSFKLSLSRQKQLKRKECLNVAPNFLPRNLEEKEVDVHVACICKERVWNDLHWTTILSVYPWAVVLGGTRNINLVIQPLQYSLWGCFTPSMCSFCNKNKFPEQKTQHSPLKQNSQRTYSVFFLCEEEEWSTASSPLDHRVHASLGRFNVELWFRTKSQDVLWLKKDLWSNYELGRVLLNSSCYPGRNSLNNLQGSRTERFLDNLGLFIVCLFFTI